MGDNRVVMWLVGASSALLVVLVCGFLAAVIPVSDVYPAQDAGLVKVHKDQCERPQDRSAVAERHNSWSNLAYFLAGFLVLLRARTGSGIFFGINLMLLAFASGLYHATLNHTLQVLDVVWVYGALFSLILQCSYVFTRGRSLAALPWWVWIVAVLLQLIVLLVMLFAFDVKEVIAFLVLSVLLVPGVQFLLILINRNTGQPAPWYWWLAATVVLLIGGYLIRAKWGWDSDAVFPILVGNVLVLGLLVVLVLAEAGQEGRLQRIFAERAGLLATELVVIAGVTGIGFALRLLDGYRDDASRKLLCLPDSLFQAHAWWHVLSAASLLLMYDLMTQFEPRGDGMTEPNRPVVFPDLGGA